MRLGKIRVLRRPVLVRRPFIDAEQDETARKALHPSPLRLVRAPSAAEALVRDHAAVLRAVATRLSRSSTDGDDLVQDTIARALGSLERLGPPRTNERGWLLSILRNVFIDQCRRAAREGTGVDLDALELEATPSELEPRWARVTQAQVDGAVAQLEPAFRETYLLHVEGRSYDEISAALGVPRATVGTRLLRARRKLRDLLFSETTDA